MNWLVAGSFALLVCGTLVSPCASAQTPPALTYTQPLSAGGMIAVQKRLKQVGAYAGPADGVWGPESAAALAQFQRSHGLQETGQLNPATVATLGLTPSEFLAGLPPGIPAFPVTPAEPLAPEAVRAIQARLRQLGFYSGRIDGIWGPDMQASIEHFQQGRGLAATGQLNPATLTALGLDPNNLAAAPAAVAPGR